jgi:hypothetical protein
MANKIGGRIYPKKDIFITEQKPERKKNLSVLPAPIQLGKPQN